MVATHHLDVSLTVDDIGWHFLKFAEPLYARGRRGSANSVSLIWQAGSPRPPQ